MTSDDSCSGRLNSIGALLTFQDYALSLILTLSF